MDLLSLCFMLIELASLVKRFVELSVGYCPFRFAIEVELAFDWIGQNQALSLAFHQQLKCWSFFGFTVVKVTDSPLSRETAIKLSLIHI